jgi:hypothetical protein
MDGVGGNVGVSVGGSEVEDGEGVAGRAVALLVAVGVTSATSDCSCIPKTTATSNVSPTKTAAISPLRTGPNPLVNRCPLLGS